MACASSQSIDQPAACAPSIRPAQGARRASASRSDCGRRRRRRSRCSAPAAAAAPRAPPPPRSTRSASPHHPRPRCRPARRPTQSRKSLRSSDSAAARKKRMRQEVRDHGLVDPAGRGLLRPSVSSGCPVRSPQEIVEQAHCRDRYRTPIKSSPSIIRDIGDAADIEHRGRRFAPQPPHQSAMDRSAPAARPARRRPRPRRGNRRPPECPAERALLPSPICTSQAALRPMQQGLAVETDRRDTFRRR